MAPLDIVTLPDLSDDAPAGENLENDPEFGELEQAMKGKPEVQYGKTIEPAVPPDWKEAISIAKSLMKRTHDLRVLTNLALAQLNLQGLVPFAQSMRTIRVQLDTRWDSIHPQLDPDDDLDPMQRSNAVLPLNDPAKVLRPLRDAVLATTPRTGPISWRDIATTNGTLPVEEGKEVEKKTEALISAAFTGADPERMQAVRDAVDSALEDSIAIPAAFDKNSGSASGPNYTELTKLLRDIQKEISRYAGAAVAEEASADDVAAAEDAPAGAVSAAAGAAPRMAVATVKSIKSLTARDEALHALDLATTYFRTMEPSSPLPMLLDRARKLAGMEFLDILRDLAPGGLSEAQVFAGTTSE